MRRSSKRRTSIRWPPKTAVLLALATNASALSLANFQIITSNTIPSPCIVAYNTQIVGCSTSDFTNGNQCSSPCINGLLEEASVVQAICGGLTVNAQSLLGLTLNGNLLSTLCPGSNAGTTTTVKVTVQPSTSSRAVSTTTSLAQTTTTVTTSSIMVSSTAISSSTPTTSSSTIISVPSQTSATAETSVSTTAAETSQSTQTTATAAASTTASQDASATKGGGSPFDAVAQSQAAGSTSLWTTERLLAVFGVALLLV